MPGHSTPFANYVHGAIGITFPLPKTSYSQIYGYQNYEEWLGLDAEKNRFTGGVFDHRLVHTTVSIPRALVIGNRL